MAANAVESSETNIDDEGKKFLEGLIPSVGTPHVEQSKPSPLQERHFSPGSVKERPRAGRIQLEKGDEKAFTDTGTNRDKTIDEMRIKTMYRMVEDMVVVENGVETEKKLLYLTNKQASMFDEEGLARCIQALDLGQPKCIIRLCEAWSTSKEYQVLVNHQRLEMGQFGSLAILGAEMDVSDSIETDKQLALFMRNQLLPLAKETRALIIINSGSACAMGNALRMTFMSEVERMGSDCPFKIIGFGAALTYTYNACKGIGTVGQVSSMSDVYSERLNAIMQHETRDETELETRDLNPVCSHYVIVEGINFGVYPSKADRGALYKFSNTFLEVLSSSLPSIAIASARSLPYQTLNIMAKSGIPLLTLDFRQRAFTTRTRNPLVPLMNIAKKATQFPRLGPDDLNRLRTYEDGELSASSKTFLMELAKDMLIRQWDTLEKEAKMFDQWEVCTLAFFRAMLQTGSRDHLNESFSTSLSDCIARQQRDKAEISNADASKTVETLAAQAADFMINDMNYYAHRAHVTRIRNWLENHSPEFDYLEESCRAKLAQKEKVLSDIEANGMKLPLRSDDYPTALSNANLPVAQSPADWQAVHELLMNPNVYSASVHDTSEVQRIFGRVAKIDRLPEANSLEANVTIQDAWDHVDVYNSFSDVYKSVAKVVYMLLLLLGIAITWSVNADNLTYVDKKNTILFMSLAGSTLAGYVSFMNPALKWQQLRGAAMSIESHIWMFRTRAGEYRISGGQDFDAAALDQLKLNINHIKSVVMEGADMKTTNFFGSMASPNLHGQHPKMNGRAFGHRDPVLDDSKNGNSEGETSFIGVCLRCIFFPFCSPRVITGTREGDVEALSSVTGGIDSSAEGLRPLPITLDTDGTVGLDRILRVIHSVATGADAEAAATQGEDIDTHYMPLQPDRYCIFRIERALVFYKERLPRCNHTRYVGQFIITLGSITGVLLAMFNALTYAAVVAIFVSSTTAWMEFSGTQSKITRYSTTIGALQDLLLWWRTSAPIERSSTQNIDKLVITAEDLLKSEVNAWASTSQASKLLNKAAGGDEESSEGGDTGKKNE